MVESKGGLGEAVLLSDLALGGDALNVGATVLELLGGETFLEFLTEDVGETPELGLDEELAPGELELGTAECLHSLRLVDILAADGEQNLVDGHTGGHTVGLSVGLAHTSLEAIGTGAGKHLVDADDVEGVDTDAEMERFLVGVLSHVLVGLDTSGLKSLARDHLNFAGEAVNGQWERLNRCLPGTDVVVLDLGIRYTTAEAALWVRLVLAVPVAASWSAAHIVTLMGSCMLCL